MNKSLVECNRYMFKHQINTDVCFSIEYGDIEAKQICAHKYVLMSRSPVFNAMLYGSLPMNTDEPLKITDVEPEAFTAVLRWAYILYMYMDIEMWMIFISFIFLNFIVMLWKCLCKFN